MFILSKSKSCLLEAFKVEKYFILQIPGNVEFHPKFIAHSPKQRLFLVTYEFSGATNEVVLYWENSDSSTANSKCTTVKGSSFYVQFVSVHHGKIMRNTGMIDYRIEYYMFVSIGRDAAFIGPNENQFAILDDDKNGLALYILSGKTSQENDNEKVLEGNYAIDTNNTSINKPIPFMFETEVDRIFSTPIGK